MWFWLLLALAARVGVRRRSATSTGENATRVAPRGVRYVASWDMLPTQGDGRIAHLAHHVDRFSKGRGGAPAVPVFRHRCINNDNDDNNDVSLPFSALTSYSSPQLSFVGIRPTYSLVIGGPHTHALRVEAGGGVDLLG